MTEQHAPMRKSHVNKSNTSIVLEEPSKEDGLVNEKRSFKGGHGSTKSFGRSTVKRHPSTHTYS